MATTKRTSEFCHSLCCDCCQEKSRECHNPYLHDDFDNHSKCCLCCHGIAKIKGGSCPNVVTPFSADPLGRTQSVELPPPHFSLLSAAVEPDQIPFLHIMVNHQRKYSKSHTRLPKSRRSIHQLGPNATFTVQGTYNDVGRDQNIINVTYSGGTLRIIQPEQILT